MDYNLRLRMSNGLQKPKGIRASTAKVMLAVIIILVAFAAVQFGMQTFRVGGKAWIFHWPPRDRGPSPSDAAAAR